jgi:hypothetical protein
MVKIYIRFGLGLLEILKYVVIEKKTKNMPKDQESGTRNQIVFMIFYLLIRTGLDLFLIFFILLAEDLISPWFAVLPVSSLGIIGYGLYLDILKTSGKQVISTFIFNIGYSIILAIIGRIYLVPE